MQSMIRTLFNQALQMDTYLRGGVRQTPAHGDDGSKVYVEYKFDWPHSEGSKHEVYVRDFYDPLEKYNLKLVALMGDGEPRTLDESEALVAIQAVFQGLYNKTRADVERRHRLATGAAQ